jgi:Proteasome subunit
MTIIVGVRCTDGVVVGSDSIATSAAGPTPVMQIGSNNKIEIFDGKIIVATTGSVGYKQRLQIIVRQAVNGGVFNNFKKDRLCQHISSKLLLDLQSSLAPRHPTMGFMFGAIMATVIDNSPCLIEFSTTDFQHEFKEHKLFFVSMGSGQPLADPFLAFVSRVLWKDTLPDVKLGRFGLYWVLAHTIKHAPGLVGDPICLATLSKPANEWMAAETTDDQEAAEFIASVEARIGESIVAAQEVIQPAAPPVPQPT